MNIWVKFAEYLQNSLGIMNPDLLIDWSKCQLDSVMSDAQLKPVETVHELLLMKDKIFTVLKNSKYDMNFDFIDFIHREDMIENLKKLQMHDRDLTDDICFKIVGKFKGQAFDQIHDIQDIDEQLNEIISNQMPKSLKVASIPWRFQRLAMFKGQQILGREPYQPDPKQDDKLKTLMEIQMDCIIRRKSSAGSVNAQQVTINHQGNSRLARQFLLYVRNKGSATNQTSLRIEKYLAKLDYVYLRFDKQVSKCFSDVLSVLEAIEVLSRLISHGVLENFIDVSSLKDNNYGDMKISDKNSNKSYFSDLMRLVRGLKSGIFLQLDYLEHLFKYRKNVEIINQALILIIGSLYRSENVLMYISGNLTDRHVSQLLNETGSSTISIINIYN